MCSTNFPVWTYANIYYINLLNPCQRYLAVSRVWSLKNRNILYFKDVGRSCILVTIAGKNVMFDCGMHMGYNDEV